MRSRHDKGATPARCRAFVFSVCGLVGVRPGLTRPARSLLFEPPLESILHAGREPAALSAIVVPTRIVARMRRYQVTLVLCIYWSIILVTLPAANAFVLWLMD